ncbi:hypothetical protein BGX28_005792 [Mortierella sp. GBA30]|nr:hypothetical protein BGX28_005792 [Mortierella sp. GBA30]
MSPLHSILHPSKTKALASSPSRPTHLHLQPLLLARRQSEDIVAFTLQDILSPPECQSLIERAEQIGFTTALVNAGPGHPGVHIPGYRDGLRAIIDDPLVANELWERIREYVPKEYKYRPVIGMNERLRFLKYGPGDQFQPHMDGEYRRTDGSEHVTKITVQFYLNEDCEGGATTFLEQKQLWIGGDEVGKKVDVACKTGQALVFQHDLVHQGSKVLAGQKYVIRSDILYGPPSAAV